MQVICLDGTTIQCARFRAIDGGVLLFESDTSQEDDEDEEATGFIPHERLRYVLPDEAQPATPIREQRAQQAGHPQQPSPGGGGTPGTGQWVQGHTPPQHAMQQQQPPHGSFPSGQPSSESEPSQRR